MRKVIFLDVDGVLNCYTSKSTCGFFAGIDKDKVKRLSKIVNDTGADIILSSSWKDGWTPRSQQDEYTDYHARYLNNHLMKKGGLEISDKTPDIGWSRRGAEILGWLIDHPLVEDYVILDDEMFRDYYNNTDITKHLVLTDAVYGITDDDVVKAISILNGENV